MPHLRFDPSQSVRFDLAHGHVHLGGTHAHLVVPAGALLELAGAAGPVAAAAFARSLGEAMGRRTAARLSAVGVDAAAVEVVLEHLGGELSLGGLGALELERWGQALVLVVDASPLGSAGDSLMEGVLAGALAAASGREVYVLTLGREGARARFLVGGERGVSRVRAWLAEGLPWGEALVRLHAPRAPTRGEA